MPYACGAHITTDKQKAKTFLLAHLRRAKNRLMKKEKGSPLSAINSAIRYAKVA